MVYVRLEKDWTDPDGTTHPAGELVDVDPATLARLEDEGVVKEPDGGWPAPDGGAGDRRTFSPPPGPDFDDDR